MGYYALYGGNSLPTYQDNPSVLNSKVRKFTSWIVTKCRQGITTSRCGTSQKALISSPLLWKFGILKHAFRSTCIVSQHHQFTSLGLRFV